MLSFWTSLRLCHLEQLTLLPEDKILDLCKLKEFTYRRHTVIHVTQKLKFILGMVVKIVGEGELSFSPFPTMFLKPSFSSENEGWLRERVKSL